MKTNLCIVFISGNPSLLTYRFSLKTSQSCEKWQSYFERCSLFICTPNPHSTRYAFTLGSLNET